MESSKEGNYTDLAFSRKRQLDKLRQMKEILADRFEHDKEEKYGDHFNLLPFFVTLIECSPLSTTKMIKPLMRAYNRAIRRQENIVRSYEMLSLLEKNGKEDNT